MEVKWNDQGCIIMSILDYWGIHTGTLETACFSLEFDDTAVSVILPEGISYPVNYML
jgi:hypothetical protein